ncbi:MAG: DPP IV N-terminal domain-containing protein [Taibaiella sp.]|nr:DPP IV N-terminal domain-containing protein [Taibaiella sp.]
MRNFKHFLPALALMAIYQPSFAQKKQFTMAEATNGMGTTLATKGIKSAGWQPGTDILWQSEKKSGEEVWTATDYSAEGGPVSRTITRGSFPDGIKQETIPAIKWLGKDGVYFVNDKTVVAGILADKKFNWETLMTLPDKAENVTVDNSKRVAWTIDNNLWMWDPQKGNIKITAEPADVICGKSVHREEFGIDKGIFFSPKGNLLAFYRMDQRMVNDYPIVKWDVVPAKAEIIKYPMAGGTSHEVTLCVYNPATGAIVTLKTGVNFKDHYLTSVTWSPDEKYIFVGILNRQQNHLLLNKYNAATGEKIKTLFEETDEKYVHPTHALTFLPGNNDEFIWWSERDGYAHLYLYNTDGKLVKQLTKGAWVVNELISFTKAGDKMIITASKESPLEKHIYSVSLESGRMERIDKGAGMHSATVSDDGKYVLDVYSAAGTPKNTYVRSVDGTVSVELMKSPDPLAEYERAQVRNITIKAADGATTLYSKMILPPNFDSNKKYPVIVYLYNGPNVQLLHNSFPESGNLWYEYMAQHGYIIFTMDGRGSWNRGMAFEQATWRRLGDVEMDDQLKAVEYLKKQNFIDPARMGVHGWSFGGFMTTSLMLRHPGIFKCAVAGGPVIDWSMYEVMYTERYMTTPKTNPEGYNKSNLLDKVKNLQGKLMLIHGASDNVVVWQHSMDLIKKSVDEGVQVDYFVYPGHEHNVRGKDRVHLMQKITNYFDDYLK